MKYFYEIFLMTSNKVQIWFVSEINSVKEIVKLDAVNKT